MDILVDAKSSVEDGKVTVSPNEIKRWTEDLRPGDKIEIDFGSYGILVYKESIKGRSSYRTIVWEGYPESGGRRYNREWKNFETGKDSTFMYNLHHAFRECGFDPEGIELRKDLNE